MCFGRFPGLGDSILGCLWTQKAVKTNGFFSFFDIAVYSFCEASVEFLELILTPLWHICFQKGPQLGVQSCQRETTK